MEFWNVINGSRQQKRVFADLRPTAGRCTIMCIIRSTCRDCVGRRIGIADLRCVRGGRPIGRDCRFKVCVCVCVCVGWQAHREGLRI